MKYCNLGFLAQGYYQDRNNAEAGTTFGISVKNTDLTGDSVVFINNQAGGLTCVDDCVVTASNDYIIRNSNGGKVEVTNSTFTSTYDGTGPKGIITTRGSDPELTVSNCIFTKKSSGMHDVYSKDSQTKLTLRDYSKEETIAAGSPFDFPTPVAKIGDTKYLSLQAAVEAATKDAKIELLKNVDLTEQLTITKPIMIDGQSYTIKAKDDVTWSDVNGEKALVLISNVNGGNEVSLENIVLDSNSKAFGLNIQEDYKKDNESAEWTAYLTNVVLQNSKGSGLTVKSNVVADDLTISGSAKGWQSIDVGPSNSQGGGAARVLTINSIANLKDERAISDELQYTYSSKEKDAQPASVTITDGLYSKGLLSDRWYWTTAEKAVAEIGDKKYATLSAAIKEVKSGETIKLLDNLNSEGISVDGTDKRKFTIDFNQKTVTFNKPGAGSTNTQTNGFQLLKGSEITFKNGNICASAENKDATWVKTDTEKGIAMLIQNYCDLTLENMVIDGTNIAHNGDNVRYILSNNCGNVKLTGSTSITASEGDFAFDVYSDAGKEGTGSYKDGAHVIVDTTGKIIGNIEFERASYEDKKIWSSWVSDLTIKNGKFNGVFKINSEAPKEKIIITGGIFSTEPKTDYVADYYQIYDNADAVYKYKVDIAEATADGYTYAQAGKLDLQPKLGGKTLESVTYYYSPSAVDDGAELKTLTSTTLNAGTYYVYGKFTLDDKEQSSKRTTFKVEQAKEATPSAPDITVTDTEVTVKIVGYNKDKQYEYRLDEGTTWKLVPGESFKLSGLKASTKYTLKLRVSESRNYKESDAKPQDFTTKGYFSVNYNANGGVGTIEAQTAVQGSSISAKSGNGFTREGYTFAGWKNSEGKAVAVGESISEGTTLYAQWTANTYTVVFDANGGTGSMSSQIFTYDAVLTKLSKNLFGKSGFTFVGWSTSKEGPVLYKDEQEVKNLAGSGTITLYAKWAEEEKLVTVTGSIAGAEGAVTVELRRGSVTFMKGDVIDNTYSIKNVPEGTYNLVATDDRNGKIVTVTYIVPPSSHTIPIEFPPSSVSSELKVSEKQNTPPVVVGGLNQEAIIKAETGKEVTVTMTVEAKVEVADLPADAEETEKDVQKGISAIKVMAGDQTLQFLDVVVTKTTIETGSSSTPETEVLHETNTLIEILIPVDMENKEDVVVYRYHGDGAKKLTPYNSEPREPQDEHYWIDGNIIHVYSNKFSQYAVAYTPKVVPQPDPEPEKPSHSSRNDGYSIWLPATAEPTPTQTPAVEPTQAVPTASPVKPTQTPASPAPFIGLLAGLGAAAVFFGLRRK